VRGDRRGEGPLQDLMDVQAARVPRSSFYAWRSKAETRAAARRRQLAGHVRRVFAAGRGAYGCRRVCAQLNREGHACSVGLVADLMRKAGLRACQPRAYKRTTIPGRRPTARPDLIGPGLHRRGARYPAGRGYHLPVHRRGLAVPGDHDRPWPPGW
jgi:HTH-like domain